MIWAFVAVLAWVFFPSWEEWVFVSWFFENRVCLYTSGYPEIHYEDHADLELAEQMAYKLLPTKTYLKHETNTR